MPGPIQYGTFFEPFPPVDFAGWEAPAPWRRRRFWRKAWVFGGACTPRHVVGIALADAGYAAVAFAYAYCRRTGRFLEEKATVPFGFARDFEPRFQAPWAFTSGRRSWRVEPQPGGGLVVAFTGRRLRATLTFPTVAGGVTAVAPAGERPFNQTYKLAAAAVRSELSLGDEHEVDEGAHGLVDYTAGYPARRIHWGWACLAGRTASGETFGANLVTNFNDGLENALFVAGRGMPAGPAVITVPSSPAASPWQIATTDGRFTVTLTPEGARRETLRLGFTSSVYIQPFGAFAGDWLRPDGRRERVEGFGVVEDHAAVW